MRRQRSVNHRRLFLFLSRSSPELFVDLPGRSQSHFLTA